MTPSELAAKLNGIDTAYDINENSAEAKAAGLVIVWGELDDYLVFRGAIDDALGAWGGTEVLFRDREIYRPCPHPNSCPHEQRVDRTKMPRMQAIWNDDPRLPAWTLNIPWPHETFDIVDYDGVTLARGAVFSLADIPAEVE